MAEMAVGEQRKEVMPQFLWLKPSLYEHVKENCPGVISMSLSDVGTMLTTLLCLSYWICSKISTASGEKLAPPSPQKVSQLMKTERVSFTSVMLWRFGSVTTALTT